MSGFDVIGKEIVRRDAYEKATGRAKYVADLRMPGMVYAKMIHSPVAHAIFNKIDISKAAELPGVIDITTYEDIPNIPYSSCGHPRPYDTPADMLIYNRHARYIGDPLGCIVAETPEIAEAAVKLVTFEYEELPFYTDTRESLAEGAFEIHEGSGNLAGYTPVEFGDLEGAFKNAAYVFEDVTETPIVTHSPIETHLSLVEPEPGSGRLNVYASNQSVFILRERIATALGRPIRDIRVIKGYVGGGFGGKQEPIYEIINCFAAAHCGRPVLLELTREESLAMTRTRHSDRIRIRSALDKDFHFIARDAELIANTGAYSAHGHNVALASLGHANALYPVPNFRFVCKTVYTNITIASAMRAYGGPQWHYAMESHIDNICLKLNLDPCHFREINACYPGGPFYTHDLEVGSSALPEMIAGGRRDIGWDTFEKNDQGTVKRGIGMALASYGQSCFPHSVETTSARVIVHEDGSTTLAIGATEIGQGAETTFAMMAAEGLGFPYEWIMMPKEVDTDVAPFDPGAYASRQTYVTGQAVKKAAVRCKEDILDFAAKDRELDREKIDIKRGDLVSIPDEKVICPIKDITWKMYYSHPVGSVVEHEEYYYPTTNSLTFGAAFAVVSVDTATGEVNVEKLRANLDSGVIINPMAARGQLLGGAMMSYGYGMTEQILINKKTGAVYNDNLLDYKVPTMADVPDLDGRFFESIEPSSAYGNKSMGEPPNIAPAIAIRNAVLNATGVPMNKFPLTPERVWQFLHPEEEDQVCTM